MKIASAIVMPPMIAFVFMIDTTSFHFCLKWLYPSCGVLLDEGFGAFPASRTHDQRAVLTFQPHTEIKERATLTLLEHPFRQKLVRLFVVRKLELVPIRQFSNGFPHRPQRGAENVEVPLSNFGSQGQRVTSKG